MESRKKIDYIATNGQHDGVDFLTPMILGWQCPMVVLDFEASNLDLREALRYYNSPRWAVQPVIFRVHCGPKFSEIRIVHEADVFKWDIPIDTERQIYRSDRLGFHYEGLKFVIHGTKVFYDIGCLFQQEGVPTVAVDIIREIGRDLRSASQKAGDVFKKSLLIVHGINGNVDAKAMEAILEIVELPIGQVMITSCNEAFYGETVRWNKSENVSLFRKY